MKAIRTIYRDNCYRSRLEARWAAFFDIIEWRHTYEPFDANGYIPDFLIHGARPLLIEVKPAVTLQDFRAPIRKIENGLAGHWNHDYLIVGASPVADLPSSFDRDFPAAGILGECYPSHRWDDDAQQQPDDTEWDPGIGLWHECLQCRTINVFHDSNWFAGRPCGHHDGDHYLGHIHRGAQALEDVWSTAGRLTQWKAS